MNGALLRPSSTKDYGPRTRRRRNRRGEAANDSGKEKQTELVDLKVYRKDWDGPMELIIHADESHVKHHASYHAGKSGDVAAAIELVGATITRQCLDKVSNAFRMGAPILVAAHAVEREGVNAIPQAMAGYLGRMLGWSVEDAIVQTNVVAHTGADGFGRLARQAEFSGLVVKDAHYLMVDDFVGQGGTLANLRGYLMHQGGKVVGGTVLTGKPYSAMLSCDEEQIEQLRQKHGEGLESWWNQRFGFGYACLTRSEARYLLNTPTSERIRNRIAEAFQM